MMALQVAINAGVEVLLVGDSLGMTVQDILPPICEYGRYSPSSQSVNNLINKFIIADMPFMSYSNINA